MAEKIDSIFFDMDGTLWNAVDSYTKAWNEYLVSEENGKPISSDLLSSLMGEEEELVLSQILPQMDKQVQTILYNKHIIPLIYKVVETDGGHLYDGVLKGLSLLSKKYKLFIVSNCPERLIECFIRYAGIDDLITDSLAYGQNFRPKSENMVLLKEKYKLRHPVYAGDTDSDRIQCKMANIPFFYMDYGFGKCNQYAQKFSRFNDFVEFMLLTSSEKN